MWTYTQNKTRKVQINSLKTNLISFSKQRNQPIIAIFLKQPSLPSPPLHFQVQQWQHQDHYNSTSRCNRPKSTSKTHTRTNIVSHTKHHRAENLKPQSQSFPNFSSYPHPRIGFRWMLFRQWRQRWRRRWWCRWNWRRRSFVVWIDLQAFVVVWRKDGRAVMAKVTGSDFYHFPFSGLNCGRWYDVGTWRLYLFPLVLRKLRAVHFLGLVTVRGM